MFIIERIIKTCPFPQMTFFARTLILATIVSGLLACSGTINKHAGPTPDWIQGDSASYPPALYLSATGQNRYMSAAKREATEKLLQHFQPSTSPALQSLHSGETQKIVQSLHKAVKQRIQIVDTWYNNDNSEYYVLAIIHKGQVAEDVKKHIHLLDEASSMHIDKTGSSRVKLTKIFHAGNALYQQTIRAHYAQLLKTLDPGSGTIRQVWTVQSLQDSFTKLLNRIYIKPVIINDDLSVLRDSLSNALTRLGLSLADGVDADYLLESTLIVDKRQVADGRENTEATVSLKLMDPQHVVYGQRQWPITIQAVANDRSSALAAARTSTSHLFEQELLGAFLEFSKIK